MYKKITYLTISLLLLYSLSPFSIAFCFSDASYVWSEINSSAMTTSNLLSQNERKFFKSLMWKCCFNRPKHWNTSL